MSRWKVWNEALGGDMHVKQSVDMRARGLRGSLSVDVDAVEVGGARRAVVVPGA